MRYKKFLSIILSALFMFVSVLSVSAAPKTAEISINQGTFTVDVTVTTDEAVTGRVTAQIRNEANDHMPGMDETSEFTTTEDGKYQYQFHFKMQPSDDSGTYFVHVGGEDVVQTKKEFTFINVNDKVDFYNALNEATQENDGIYNILAGEESNTAYDLTEYKKLTSEVRSLVDEKIEGLDLAATMENVEEVETRFMTEMNVYMLLAKIVDVPDEINDEMESSWDAAVKEAIEQEIVDGEYYSETLTKSIVMEYFKSESELTLDEEEISDAMDRAILLSVADELDYASLQSAFEYYLEKGVVNVNESNFNEIYDNNLDDDLFKELKDMDNNTSVTKLQENADEIMQDLLDDLEYNDNPGGGGGSTGGGSSSRPSGSGSRNPNPGSGTVINGDAENNTNNSNNEEPVEVNFSDLSSAQWAESSIKYLAGKGIVSGRGDGKFYPNDVMTREEFVKLVVLAFDAYDASATASFDDVSADSWSYSYIASAARLGIVTGNENNEFDPAGSITRQDMAVIMHRVYSIAGLSGAEAALDFSDADEISGYAQEAVSVLVGANIINGMGDGTFAPKGLVTRAQASKVAYELLMLIGGEN